MQCTWENKDDFTWLVWEEEMEKEQKANLRTKAKAKETAYFNEDFFG